MFPASSDISCGEEKLAHAESPLLATPTATSGQGRIQSMPQINILFYGSLYLLYIFKYTLK